jgi:arylsulfatase A-like enzyme
LPAPHKPVLPLPRFKGSSKAGDYGDYVVEVDWVVGNIVKSLKEKGLYDNTLLIFTSDNGSFANMPMYGVTEFNHKVNKNLKGGKTDIWEGGHRVPFIATWPKAVKSHQVYRGAVSTTDVFATVADVLNVKYPDSAGEDSWSFLPALKGVSADKFKGQARIFHSINGTFAIRKGKWKLVTGKGSGGRGKGVKTSLPGQLYDLENDLEEKNNLFASYPEVVKNLAKELETIVKNGRTTPGKKQRNVGKVRCMSNGMKAYLAE